MRCCSQRRRPEKNMPISPGPVSDVRRYGGFTVCIVVLYGMVWYLRVIDFPCSICWRDDDDEGFREEF